MTVNNTSSSSSSSVPNFAQIPPKTEVVKRSLATAVCTSALEEIVKFVPAEDSLALLQSCKAFYYDPKIVAASFDLSGEKGEFVVEKIEKKLNGTPVDLTGVLQNDKVRCSLKVLNITFSRISFREYYDYDAREKVAQENERSVEKIVKTFPQLEVVRCTNVNNCNGLQSLNQLTQLRHIALDDSDRSRTYQNARKLLAPMAKTPNLEILDLRKYLDSAMFAEELYAATKLKTLVLEGHLERVEAISKMVDLEDLALDSVYSARLEAANLARIAASCPKLKGLMIFHLLDDAGIETLSRMIQIERLGVRTNSDLSPLQKLINLKILRFHQYDTVSIANIYLIPNLEKLNLGGCLRLTDSCIPDILKCEQLKEVLLSGTQISEKGLEELRKARPNLKVYKD